jgi:hypothetical protein
VILMVVWSSQQEVLVELKVFDFHPRFRKTGKKSQCSVH